MPKGQARRTMLLKAGAGRKIVEMWRRLRHQSFSGSSSLAASHGNIHTSQQEQHAMLQSRSSLTDSKSVSIMA